jgi:hypothetical protein
MAVEALVTDNSPDGKAISQLFKNDNNSNITKSELEEKINRMLLERRVKNQ